MTRTERSTLVCCALLGVVVMACGGSSTNQRVCGAGQQCVEGCMNNKDYSRGDAVVCCINNNDEGRAAADFCNMATMSCVECLTNNDCGGGSFCLPDHTCQ